jgi:hypothetical protein
MESLSKGAKPVTFKRRWWLWALFAAATSVGMIYAWLLANHNYRVAGQSRAEFQTSLDSSLSADIEYLDSRRMELVHYSPNCALTYMIHNMARLSKDNRLVAIVEGYETRYPDYYWLQMVYSGDENRKELDVVELPRDELLSLTADQRWFYHAYGGSGIKLDETELALLMSPSNCTARKLTHQLLALNFLLHDRPEDEELEKLRMKLCERISDEAAGDFRVNDMLYQRISTLLMSGRDDLVEPRWVEQIIAFQQADGGWGFGYLPLAVESVVGEQASNEHAAVQAAWVLCQIRYRYPDWITEHYDE